MAAYAPPAPLTEAVKKVDRAVTRLEELQSTIRSRRSNAGERRRGYRQELASVRQKVDVHVDKKPATSRRGTLGSSRDVNRPCSDAQVPKVGMALHQVGTHADKENAGGKKKKKKKSSTPLDLPSLSPSAKTPPHRKVLESRPVNVSAVQGAPSPLSSASGAKENCWPKAGDTLSSSNGRPPWRNVTVISTNNRHPATIAERVALNSASASGAQNVVAGLKGNESSKNAKGQQRRVSLPPVSGRTSNAGAAATSRPPSSGREDLDFTKTFCVDVRPDPNRPWRLASKMSNTSRPLVMFPNPAFRTHADEGAHADARVVSCKLPQAPFKSFQIRPLKLSSLQQQQPVLLSPPATIRPYLSPSKTSPRQSQQQDEDPLPHLFNSSAPSSSTLNCMKKPLQESNASASKESWFRKRLSFPCSSSSSAFIKRFSLSHSKQGNNNTTHSPAVHPLPSLITRLPTRKKPTSIDSLLNTPPPPRLGKPLASSPSTATPLISPLPLPPSLRVLTSKSQNPSPNRFEASSAQRRSSSCHLRAEDRNIQRDIVGCRSLSSRGLQEMGESIRKKPLYAVPGCRRSSVWPSIKRSSSSSCKHRASDCTSNCTGAGPFLFKHVRGWITSL